MKKGTLLRGAIFAVATLIPVTLLADAPLSGMEAHPPIHINKHSATGPVGYSPTQMRTAYNLSGSGSGTIAIVDAYDAPTVEKDLGTFSAQYGLPACTTANKCFTKHMMVGKVRADSGWALEASLDTQWAHAIAPGAKILLVEAKSASLSDLLSAVDYARSQAGVVAVSMSWGGSEFSSESSYDSHFVGANGMAFFASSGDNGSGVGWPAVSSNVVGVGGTSLVLSSTTGATEVAWSGSGGGRSAYEAAPAYQVGVVQNSNSKRAVPDVSYDADPQTGVAVYDSTSYQGKAGWFQVGGTSAGAPQWAAIRALGTNVNNVHFYQDAQTSSYSAHFRDVISGTNGTCGALCSAGVGYDYITGLGSPLVTSF